MTFIVVMAVTGLLGVLAIAWMKYDDYRHSSTNESGDSSLIHP